MTADPHASPDASCSTPGQPNSCATNMGLIHLQAGDLVGAYRYFLPLAEKGERDAIEALVDICEKGGDIERANSWRAQLSH